MNRTFARRLARLGTALLLGLAPGAFTHAEDMPPASTLPAQELTPQTLYRFLLAEIAGARGQLGLSSQLYIEIARDTRDPRIAKRAAEIALFARNADLAAEAARIWSEADPGSDDAKRLLAGVVANHGGRLEDVQIQLARALALAPASLDANLMSLNRALSRMEDKRTAQSIVFRLTEPYLDHPEAHFARAQAAAIAESPMEALTAINAALALREDWDTGLLFKAQLLMQTGAHAEASQLLQAAAARHPDNRNIRLGYARSLIAAKHYDVARAEFQALLADAPTDLDLLYAVALLSLQLDDAASAEPLLIKALEGGHPEADTIRLHLGQIAEQRKDGAAARKWFDSVAPGPKKLEARIRSAQSLAREGRLSEARAQLQPTAGDENDAHRLLLAEAQLLREADRTAEAFDVIDNALLKSPDDTDLLYESAMLAERLNRLEVMEGRLRKVIALAPDHAHAMNALGYSLADRGLRLDEAEALITRAHELAPDDAFILDSLGWVRFRRGDAATALTHLERAYALRADPEIAAHMGEVLWQLDRRADAERLFDAAIAAHPDNAVLRATAARLRKQ
ncbi:tetratricopeptide repeat protein [Azoarcus sp. L1K30]|uniref:tetratricopeptide repeat protein n=1 Tax=Azoarcus sp. L1K30 TaxID=2820277 RepID=UPI001B83FFBC|nr:tetratricopeptide repeat protein [Azoarcus sp. L1K30]MBR0568265.1 tetratricopeptide repeat protein [Azoarcus sp. L1K30]